MTPGKRLVLYLLPDLGRRTGSVLHPLQYAEEIRIRLTAYLIESTKERWSSKKV